MKAEDGAFGERKMMNGRRARAGNASKTCSTYILYMYGTVKNREIINTLYTFLAWEFRKSWAGLLKFSDFHKSRCKQGLNSSEGMIKPSSYFLGVSEHGKLLAVAGRRPPVFTWSLLENFQDTVVVVSEHEWYKRKSWGQKWLHDPAAQVVATIPWTQPVLFKLVTLFRVKMDHRGAHIQVGEGTGDYLRRWLPWGVVILIGS